jgi:phosphohistidine phosphatase
MTKRPLSHLLLLLRHGIAEDAERDQRDEDRRLTSEGKRKLRNAVGGMRMTGIPVEVILTSPLRRARETAEIVAEGYDGDADAVIVTPALNPAGGTDAVFAVLAEHNESAAIMLVGHQPDMGELASTLLAGTPTLVQLPFKKAGLAGITVASLPPRSAGVLEFFVTPAQLRRMGRG